MELMKITLHAMFMITIITLSTQHNHLMIALMCVETMMLIVFTMLVMFTSISMATSQIPMPVMMLTLSVCGAAVGLSLVVAITRTHGNDFLKSLNLL